MSNKISDVHACKEEEWNRRQRLTILFMLHVKWQWRHMQNVHWTKLNMSCEWFIAHARTYLHVDLVLMATRRPAAQSRLITRSQSRSTLGGSQSHSVTQHHMPWAEVSLASEQPLAMTELKRHPVWPAALGPADIEALCDNFIINEWLKANWHQTTSASGTGEYSYCRLLTELTDGQLAASAHR